MNYDESPSPLPSLPSLPASPDLYQIREENLCPELLRAVEGVKYIADVTRRDEESNKVYKQNIHFTGRGSFIKRTLPFCLKYFVYYTS